MASEYQPAVTGKKMLWSGRVISGLVTLFLLMGGVMGTFRLGPAAEGVTRIGYPEHVGVPIALVMLACTVVYAIPSTSVLGAILLTGYLGGATASHVRIEEPWFAPVIVGVLTWLGLFLRNARLRALLPLCR